MKSVHAVLVIVAISGGATACSRDEAPPPGPAAGTAPAPPSASSPPQISANTIVTQISQPDEALKALSGVKPEDWKQYLDTGTAVSSSEKPKVALAIGMQSANAMVAAYAGDDAGAEKLATSVKGLADRLSLKSAQLETLVAKTATDLKEPDAAKRSAIVRSDIAAIQDEVKATLDRLGDGATSTLMLFGAWIEGVRISSAHLKAKYDAVASDVLNRKSEADFFLSSFAAAPSDAGPIYGQIVPILKRLRDAMVADPSHQISASSANAINAAASELSALLRK